MTSRAGTDGVERDGLSGALPFVFGSSFAFLSGRAGNAAGSYSGASIRGFPSGLFVLVLVRLDSAEPVDLAETVEATDSMDDLLPVCCSDGLRGGSEGTGLSSSTVDVRAGRGGRLGVCGAAAGWFPVGFVELTPLLSTGGLFTDAERCSAGRFGNGGGGAFLFSGKTCV